VKILASSLAHSSRLGSEPLVGFRAVEALANHCETMLLATGRTIGCRLTMYQKLPARLVKLTSASEL
jgi:hypothetical protein